ncbi:MAG: metal-dependent phosphohydrolase [Actinoplanes sp.]
MSVLTRPRATMIDTAIELSRGFCEGHIIDGSPALGHALKVARKVGKHHPTASPDLVAAVILHDAPDFAPADMDLDNVLTERLSPAVTRIVRAIEREHEALGRSEVPDVQTDDLDVLIATAADKVVSIGAITQRARRSPDPVSYWGSRRPFIKRVPYFRAFAAAAEPHLPAGLARELTAVVSNAYDATARYRWPLS